MSTKNPHLLKSHSLFALFCLSYFPLFLLLIIKILVANKEYLNFGGFGQLSVQTYLYKFAFPSILAILITYAWIGTHLTLRNIIKKESNAFPTKVTSIRPKNEEALSYLASYVIPLMIQGETGMFEYATFVVLFTIYYKLYATSSLILINPILNMKYGLYEIEYEHSNKSKNALIISKHRWLEEGDMIKLIKLSHNLYFAY